MTSYARLMYTMCLVAKSPYNIILERFLLLMNILSRRKTSYFCLGIVLS